MVERRGSRKLTWVLLTLLLLVLTGLVLRRVADAHLRAMSVLARFSNPRKEGFVTSFARGPFREELGTAQTPQGTLQFRLYIPQEVKHAHAMVLLHGIHHLGMEEPRLVSFARALAGAGLEVMTPELQDLADYRVTPRTIDVIGTSAIVLSTRMNEPVGVMGLSFAGGLALLAATKPEYAQKIGFVAAIGAHDDMARVARFYADDLIERPDGSTAHLQAHDYGVLVLAYAHLDDFFSPSDVPAARDSIRLWLWEKHQDAMAAERRMSAAGQAEFDRLVQHHELAKQQILREIQEHQAEMDAVSPHGHLAQLKVPAYLLHGSGDTVIPASETEWLARDVPKPDLKAVLVSPALIHVSMEEAVPVREEWALVDFLAGVLAAANGLEH
ncbi:MAG: alpha/beta hydrolase [Candidatus Angelobacter sp.]